MLQQKLLCIIEKAVVFLNESCSWMSRLSEWFSNSFIKTITFLVPEWISVVTELIIWIVLTHLLKVTCFIPEWINILNELLEWMVYWLAQNLKLRHRKKNIRLQWILRLLPQQGWHWLVVTLEVQYDNFTLTTYWRNKSLLLFYYGDTRGLP